MPNADWQWDWQRLLWGTDPLAFYGEILLRSFVMYVVLLLLLRFLSKRALTQLSILEFGIVIVLGSAAGDPTFYKDVPLFHGIVVLIVIVLMQRLYTYYLRHSETVETAMEGTPIEMLYNGVIQENALKHEHLTQEELFQLLRYNGISQLGEVSVAYMEQNGQLSVFKQESPVPGLAIVPPWDLQAPELLSASVAEDTAGYVCIVCGSTRGNCSHQQWIHAVIKGNPQRYKKDERREI